MVSKSIIPSITLMIIMVIMSMRLCAQSWYNLRFIGNHTDKSIYTETEMKDIFKAKYNFWQNKLPVIICLPQSQSAEAKEICEKIYGKSVDEVKKFWLSQVFQGRSRSPHFFNSPEEMIGFINKTPGSIGILKADPAMHINPSFILQVN